MCVLNQEPFVGCRKPKIPETSQGQGHVRDNEAVFLGKYRLKDWGSDFWADLVTIYRWLQMLGKNNE